MSEKVSQDVELEEFDELDAEELDLVVGAATLPPGYGWLPTAG